ncbi:hypothetical protein PanWU01x14_070510, partial [Parasponia andersonii]
EISGGAGNSCWVVGRPDSGLGSDTASPGSQPSERKTKEKKRGRSGAKETKKRERV